MATPLTADTELVVDPQGAGRAFVLRRGSARFVVPHDERHAFRLRAGPLIIEDLGTVFTVSQLSNDQFDVDVREGQVAVLCQASRVELGGGQRQTFTCREPGPVAVAQPEMVAERQHAKAPPAWRILAERGQYHRAYDVLHSEGKAVVHDEPNELLLAADTARLSGHPSEAVPYLRRILLQHGSDPRAHLVAFTLGRVLLDELGQPAAAAEAFARARVRNAPLAEDALAREIEAWARAGDAGRAHTLALEYQRNYPQGRRLRQVAKFGGLER
jgi:transmembrane sensor